MSGHGDNLAIIPARGGSKRIPGKNIIDFMGKPMIAWTIEAALESGVFAEVVVSTDSEEIAAVARQSGAAVPFLREPGDADDLTPSYVATLNYLLRLEARRPAGYGTVAQLMPNCPCRTARDIAAAYENFRAGGADFQISGFKYGWMNPWWALKVDERTRRTEPLFPEALKQRSQDLGRLYCPTGAIWLAKADRLKAEKTFYGPGYTVHELDWQSAVDIDDYEDLKMAEAVMLMRGRHGH